MRGYLKRIVLRGLLRTGTISPLAALYSRILAADGRPRQQDRPRPTVLALNPGRFRGDLEVLEASGHFRVLRVPFVWQARMLPYFLPGDVGDFEWFGPRRPAVTEARERYREVLTTIARRLRDRHGIDVVIGAAMHYLQDIDWGVAFERAGVPYIVFHRENLVTSKALRGGLIDLFSDFDPFPGSHLVVHNEIMKEIFLETGYVEEEKISALGALRMDNYLHKVKSTQSLSIPEKVVCFSFHHLVELRDLKVEDPDRFDGVWSTSRKWGWVELFDQTHATIARFARDHPNVEVIIKAKWGGRWLEEIRRAIRAGGLDPDIDNLLITADGDAQDLLLQAKVVCGFGSTTLLEAAITPAFLITPWFAEVKESKYEDRLPFADEEGLFRRARSREELYELLEEGLTAQEPTPPEMQRRIAAFEKYVSPYDGSATESYIALLRQIAREAVGSVH